MIAFRANKAGVVQTNFALADNYNQVTGYSFASPLTYNFGDRFLNDEWTPVAVGEAPRMVIFSGQLWAKNCTGSTGYSTPNPTTRVVKNGAPSAGGVTILAHIGTMAAFKGTSGAYNTFVSTISCQDLAMPGDVYRQYHFVNNLDAVIDGHPMHTVWCGMAI